MNRVRLLAIIGLLLPFLGMAAEVNTVFETSFESSKDYDNPFMELEVDVLFTKGDMTWKVPAFWDGGKTWKVRFAAPEKGEYSYRAVASDKSNKGLNTGTKKLTVTEYTGDNPLYGHGQLRVTKNKRHFEHADGTPFFWLGDTWWKGLCKRLPWEGFQELTADRKEKGFTVIQIVCGTYPDELGLLKPSWENEGGMPYLKRDFSEVNPEYFKFADRRFEHLVDAGITPAIVGGWGRAVGLNAVGLPGYKRHFRNLIARYGAYPVIWVLGGETDKGQGPWYALAEYVDATDPYDRLFTNHSSHLRRAFDDIAVFDFDMDATGHASWGTANAAIDRARKTLAASPAKPYISGESCYEQHMQENFADLQRYQFWGLMLSGAAGHTYGAAGIWHMGVPEEHGNWGGWGHQPYDYTTWKEGMQLQGSRQLGLSKAVLEQYAWQRFEPHPEWAESGAFAAGIPGEVCFVYQPKRGNYKWDGITAKGLKPGTWSAFFFDPASGRRFDLGTTQVAGPWKSPNVPSPRDWVLVLQAQTTGEALKLPDGKVGRETSGKLKPVGAAFSKKSGRDWLKINPDGSYSGTPGETHAGRNTFLVSVKAPGENDSLLELTINVIGAGGELFTESFGGYKGSKTSKQFQSGLKVAHGGTVAGWIHSGFNATHAVDRSFGGGEVTPSDWAIMIVNDNVIISPVIDANAAGESYRVAFEAGPAVYAMGDQATRAGDALRVAVIREDGSVLKSFTHAPGKWSGKADFSAASFEYAGDGSGPVRIRIGSAEDKPEARFMGAIDNLVIRKITTE